MTSIKTMVTDLISADALDLILYPTEQCNFRCTYCYEDFSIGRMTEDVQLAVKRLISQQARNVKLLTLAWFGGEPMVARDIMLDVARHAAACASQSGTKLKGIVTTNGYFLTPKIMADFVALGHDHFQVSLDGFGEDHDNTRKLISGGGTFARIWRNLLDLRSTDLQFKVTLRLHLTRTNLASIELLLSKLAEASFRSDKRFVVLFKIVNQLADAPAADTAVLSRSEAPAVLEQMRALASGLDLDVAEPDQIKVCYASRPNSVAIRATGKLQKCTVMLNDSANDVGELMPDGTLRLEPKKMLPWMEGILTEDPSSLACPAGAISKARVASKHRTIPIEVV
ncbi:hypothetical protein C0Z18_28550 [Trinickia dabaoshanensis]|uniref:Radical SAM core domain-containing protein n=1 Tax=Trinickia dabaoshanensis TaxID=564714 RepID=A0A2N7VD88_9BURK|nr:radical SAM protein [Trinickia dabaoshanensis]PMS15116.1 hypothetical protein C0Z18_28550 [Trinickia dabaoshanensis]